MHSCVLTYDPIFFPTISSTREPNSHGLQKVMLSCLPDPASTDERSLASTNVVNCRNPASSDPYVPHWVQEMKQPPAPKYELQRDTVTYPLHPLTRYLDHPWSFLCSRLFCLLAWPWGHEHAGLPGVHQSQPDWWTWWDAHRELRTARVEVGFNLVFMLPICQGAQTPAQLGHWRSYQSMFSKQKRPKLRSGNWPPVVLPRFSSLLFCHWCCGIVAMTKGLSLPKCLA